jgi:hypothetical protein
MASRISSLPNKNLASARLLVRFSSSNFGDRSAADELSFVLSRQFLTSSASVKA